MALELIIFDLDGVIFDSGELVLEASRRAVAGFCAQSGQVLPVPGAADVGALMGRPNREFVQGLGPGLPEEAQRDLADRLLLAEEDLIREGRGRLHPGIRELLDWLQAAGIRSAIASNCRRGYLVSILEYYGLEDCFTISFCSSDTPGGDKADLLRMALEHQGVLGSETLYLGDRDFDATAAREAGTGFIACLWGFGSPSDFPPETVSCGQPGELIPLLQRVRSGLQQEPAQG